MSTGIMLLAVAGVIAVALRLARALFVALRGGVDSFLAGDIAQTRAQRGDLTGIEDARAAGRTARRQRMVALGAASVWFGLLIFPNLTPWPRLLYACYALLWLVPRGPRPAPRA